ncbi:hypothetical protein ACLOJK_018979, partial [Asimina triloba]
LSVHRRSNNIRCSALSKELQPNPPPVRLRSTDRSRPLSTAGDIQTATTHSIDGGWQLIDGGHHPTSSSPVRSGVTAHRVVLPSPKPPWQKICKEIRPPTTPTNRVDPRPVHLFHDPAPQLNPSSTRPFVEQQGASIGSQLSSYTIRSAMVKSTHRAASVRSSINDRTRPAPSTSRRHSSPRLVAHANPSAPATAPAASILIFNQWKFSEQQYAPSHARTATINDLAQPQIIQAITWAQTARHDPSDPKIQQVPNRADTARTPSPLLTRHSSLRPLPKYECNLSHP